MLEVEMNTKRHKHADLIHAWAEGEKIEQKYKGSWIDSKFPSFFDEAEYRIKPEKKPDDVGYIGIYIESNGSWYVSCAYEESLSVPTTLEGTERNGILRVRQSGETGKLIKADVL